MECINENPNELSSQTQNARILDYLKKGNTITDIEALQLFGCRRLASRIADLRHGLWKAGYYAPIGTDRCRKLENGKRVKEYYWQGDGQED